MKKFWCSFFLMICLVFWSSFTVFALNIPVLNQHSSQETLGTCDGCTIYSDGCAVTSLAMVLQFFNFNNLTVPAEQSETGLEKVGLSPSIVDDWLLWKGGYSYCDPSPPVNCPCRGDCMMRWPNLHNILPGLSVSDIHYNNSATGIDEQTYNFIDRALSNNRPVIARVNNFHFVVITSRNGDTYNINDPWNGVQTTLEAGELGSYHVNHCRYFSGSLVRCIEDPEQRIYWLQNGKLYWITEMSVISAMSSALGWSETQDFNEGDFNIENYSQWPNVPRFISQSSDSDGLLIKLPDDPKIYLIENGERRWITAEDVFNERGYDWNDNITVTPAILALIPEGDPIYSSQPDFYLLSGTLTDANGNSLRGYIYANETSGANLGNHVYSSDGTYEMALFPGTYRVYVQVYNSYPGGYYYFRTPYETLTINANATLNITVPSYELYHLTGKVTDANGVGLPNISVRAYNSNNIYQSYATTNSDGTYEALVTPGTYYLYFVPPANSGFLQKNLYNIPIYNDYYQEVSLDSQEQYTLSGTLTDTNGNPLRGWVYANQIGGSYRYNNDYSSDGTYEMNLFLGTYRVYARTYTYNYSSGSSTYIDTPYQNLTINTDTTFDIVAPSYDLFNLTGKVTDINNVAQANVNIAAYNNSGICQGYVRTDANGDYNLKLIPGTYRLRITAPPATYPPFEIQNLQISGDSVRNIRLSLEYTILEQAIAQLLANLELSLDVFDIINQEETLNYDVIIQGIKDLLQIILNWQGSEMKITLYDPNGAIYGEYQSTNPPINIEIPNPTAGIWSCEVTAVDVPHDNYPFALVVGISPNQAPVADANGPYSGTVDTPITFDASDSYDPDGEITTYEWDWDGDGVYDQSSNSATITHTWTEPYSGTIYLRVKDSEGATDTDNTSVEITAAQEVPGDLDGDGDVDYDDYLLFRPAYGSCEGDANFLPAADLDGDGCVTMNDYRLLRSLM